MIIISVFLLLLIKSLTKVKYSAILFQKGVVSIMAFHKTTLAALKLLTHSSPDIKKTYKIHRQIVTLAHKTIIKSPYYKIWNHKITRNGYDIAVRIFSPPNDLPHPVLLFFHGGGWVTGNIESYDNVCFNMALMTDRIVVSVDYRLAPEYPFPTALEDCYCVAKEIFLDNSLLKTNPDEITIIGDSAGGNLAAALSLMARDKGEFLPKQQILIYPATFNNHTETSPFISVRENGTDYILTAKTISDYMEMYCPDKKNWRNPYFAPLLEKDFSRQPRTLIITAEYCPLRDEGEAYGRKLQEAGIDVTIERIPDALHGYFSSLPNKHHLIQNTYKIINKFLQE